MFYTCLDVVASFAGYLFQRSFKSLFGSFVALCALALPTCARSAMKRGSEWLDASRRFELASAIPGKSIATGFLSTRLIGKVCTVDQLLRKTVELVQWPASHVELMIGGERLSERSRAKLADLVKDTATVRVEGLNRQAPSDYSDVEGMCLCDFVALVVVV